jgi:hypothetical protein
MYQHASSFSQGSKCYTLQSKYPSPTTPSIPINALLSPTATTAPDDLELVALALVEERVPLAAALVVWWEEVAVTEPLWLVLVAVFVVVAAARAVRPSRSGRETFMTGD